MRAAIRDYREYLKLEPDSVPARSNLGAALAKLGEYEDAIPEYREALRLAPDNAAIALNLALAYYKLGEIPKAASQLVALRTGQSDSRQVNLLLGDCWLRLGENKKVIAMLSPLYDAHSDDEALEYMLGTALIRDNQVNRGQLVIDKILRRGDSAEAQLLMGATKLSVRDYSGALKDLARAADLNPSLPSVHAYYGQALLATGDESAAMQEFRKELQQDPNDFDSNLNLGALLRRDENFDDAARYIERALRVRPGDPGAEFQLASLETGDADGAAAAFRKELASNPTDFESNVKLGAILSNRRQFDEALPYLQRAAQVRPGSAEAHLELAALYAHTGKPDEARRERGVAALLGASQAPPAASGGLLPAGSIAPAFDLPKFGSAGRVSLVEMLHGKPAVVIFGSYTCPQFRSAAAALDSLYARYRDKVRFVMVYVHEAHTDENWQSTVNAREAIQLPAEKTLEEKGRHASLCTRKLNLEFPVVVDGMERKVESAYAAWPSAVYLVGQDGRVLWRSRLGAQDFARDEMRTAIERALSFR